MSEQMKLSIIVPVFRTEKYLVQCVESVLSQDYSNFELILVDDGSDDQSPAICDEYARKDPRVLVFHQANAGLSAARNSGIRLATGDYILFLDSDDYWNDRSALSQLIPDLDCDVLNYGFQKCFECSDKTVVKWIPIQIKTEFDQLTTNEDKISFIMTHSCYLSCAWNKAIRRTLFEKSSLQFREGVLSEDIDWSARVLLAAESMGLSTCNFYCYRQRENSITKTIGIKHLQDLKNNIELCETFFTKHTSSRRKQVYYIYLGYQVGTFFASSSLVSNPDAKKLVLESGALCNLLKYGHEFKIKILYLVYRLSGVRGLYYFSKIYSFISKKG